MIHYKSGYKYQLDKAYTVKIELEPGKYIDTGYVRFAADGTLTASKGYAWNGANVVFDTKTIMRGALVHDALYQLIRLGVIPESFIHRCDDVFIAICKADGMCRARCWWIRRGLKRFGSTGKPRKVRTAP